jgi:ABC-type antimicrobial peptide transport system permease subunit
MRRQKLEERDGTAMVYTPIEQSPSDLAHAFVVVSATPGTDPSAELRRILQTAAPGLPYATITPLENLISERATSWKLGQTLFAAFGVLALVIASIGIYGVFSFAVAQGKREIGIRIALGALSKRVLAMVLADGVAVAAAGAAIGIIAAVLAAPLIKPLLFRISPTDPLTLFGSGAVVLGVALLASFFPARRATRIEPVIAIRSE